MHTFDHETPSISLVSWARTARPARFAADLNSDAKDRPAKDATDYVMLGCGAAALILIPLVALIVVLFG